MSEIIWTDEKIKEYFAVIKKAQNTSRVVKAKKVYLIMKFLQAQLQAEQWISADQEPEIYEQFEVYATLNGEWKIKDATFSFEFERFIFDGCQEWIPMFYRKVELPNQ